MREMRTYLFAKYQRVLLLLRIRRMCGSFGKRHRSSRPSGRHEAYVHHRASWIPSRVPAEVESETSCGQTVQPEYRQLGRRKLQLHLFPIFVEDCPQLDRETSLWSLRLGSASNTKPSIWLASNMCPPQLNEVNPIFSSFSFLRYSAP